MDAFTPDSNFVLMVTLPVIASITGAFVVIIAKFLKEIVADAMGFN